MSHVTSKGLLYYERGVLTTIVPYRLVFGGGEQIFESFELAHQFLELVLETPSIHICTCSHATPIQILTNLELFFPTLLCVTPVRF